MTELETKETETEISDEEAIKKIAEAMKDNAPSQDDKQNVHTFLLNIVQTNDTKKVGNLRDDKELNELGRPQQTVRGCLDMALISEKIMGNDYFKEYLEKEAENTLATSLSREGFLPRLSVMQVKGVADMTKRVKKNSGMFGKKTQEIQGGDPFSNRAD